MKTIAAIGGLLSVVNAILAFARHDILCGLAWVAAAGWAGCTWLSEARNG